MSKPFNYSKWDKIELSDDEGDVHPNIDKDSWFRMKHRSRLEREAKEDEEITKLNQLNSEDQSRIQIITARINGVTQKVASPDDDSEFEDIDALADEKEELEASIKKRQTKIDGYLERRKWNIDNICKVKDEKTIVNSAEIASLKAEDFTPTGQTAAVFAEQKEKKTAAASKSQSAATASSSSAVPKDITTSAASAASPLAASTAATGKINSSVAPSNPSSITTVSNSSTKKREKFAMMAYNDYVLLHEALLEQYSEIRDMEDSQKFLFQHCDILLHEHAQSYMLLSCLEDEMNGKKERMKLVCRQSQILSHITELGTQMHRDPRDVILPFFKRMEEKQYLTAFLQSVDDFRKRIAERAVVKRKELDEDAREQARREREEMRAEMPVGPGGLHPLDVLDSLPEALRLAFESQQIEKLKETIASMDPTEAKYHMKRCVDAGLWVANQSSSDGEEEEDEEVVEGEEEKVEG